MHSSSQSSVVGRDERSSAVLKKAYSAAVVDSKNWM